MQISDHINSNIQGARIKRIKADDEDQKHISASHQSHTQQVEHVDAFIELFDAYPQYNPSAELTAAAWTTARCHEKFFTSSLFVLQNPLLRQLPKS